MFKPKIKTELLTSNTALDVYNPDIVELQLLTIDNKPFNSDPVKSWKCLQEIYNNILKNDPLWHFLYEGDGMTALRIHDLSLYDVQEFLIENKVTFNNCGTWCHDSQYATKKYQKVFTYLFHGFSILAMEQSEIDHKEMRTILDRVIHCATNPWWYQTIVDFGDVWESIIISDNALRRAFYEGGRLATIEIMNSKSKKKWKKK